MTTLRDHPIHGPALHAFVIGVGQYDWFKGGPLQRTKAQSADHCRSFAQLTAPPVSATAMCEALLGPLGERPELPLGSLEVLISAEAPVRLAGDDGSTEIAPAVMSEVIAAFERWYERCDRHTDNVALFHFCGHGVQIGRGPHGLLLQDTGENMHSYFTNAIDLDTTVLGMEENAAEKQLYFVDACRSMPSSLEALASLDATALKTPPRDPRSRDRLVLRSTDVAADAYARRKSPSLFTRAVLNALSMPREPRQGSRWEVTTDTIGPYVRQLTEWPGLQEQDEPRQVCDTSVSSTKGGTVFTFDECPPVPFHFDTNPGDALSSATWMLSERTSGHLIQRRGPAAEPWQGEGPSGPARLDADFVNGRFTATGCDVWLSPPSHQNTLALGEL
ncbi:caspase family protein [Streptomyces platensis]|uniref:caspase family protein n=1 Tax=Streptomyces platensis TaxID=58346 RepID=UPI002E80D8B0|nr:caspase family protein [Streptomyces platensis]WUB79345.1 caspase family protein [Streptomyces platensis]